MSQNRNLCNVDFQLNKNFLINEWLFVNNIFFIQRIIDLIIFEKKFIIMISFFLIFDMLDMLNMPLCLR